MKIVEKVYKILSNKNQNSEKRNLTFVSVISDFIETKEEGTWRIMIRKGKKDRRRNQSI